MKLIRRSLPIGLCFLLTAGALGQNGNNSGTGLAPERLARIGAVMNEHVAKGRIAGAIGLIARRGKVGYFETYGFQDKEAAIPMREDTIFRMYSMTKPITGVAVLLLYEEGKFFLTDPVSKYLPEFASMKVSVVENDSETGKVVRAVPAKRQITILDLLRHTSGIDYRGPRDADGKFIYEKIGTNNLDQTIGEMVKKIAQSPLVHEPGTLWEYGLSMDVLARLVEVVSGKTYDKFLEERIFKPLAMLDTGYNVPPDKASRFARLYAPDGQSIKPSTAPAQSAYLKPAVNFGGGSQLVSTIRDYLRFCQMLLNGGELDGVRILSRKSVELMSADHLGDMPRGADLMGPGYGFGLTVAVSRGVGRSGAAGSAGEYYWGGAAGTRFWIDPKEQMIGIFMIQILPHTNLTYGSQFRQLAYQAISD